MFDQIKGFHIEPTNMCTLKCPRCSRTKFIEKFPKKWTNTNLNLAHLKSFLDIDLKDKSITLCGNYGDPIYYPQIFDIIDYFKTVGATINISTNGSYQTKDWWQRLAANLDNQDTITFAIDGIPENFTQYRINADWDSIKIGIDVLSATEINTVWQYIPFAFNETNIEQARALSAELEFTKFSLFQSDRWDSDNDVLKPTNYIGKRTPSIIEWRANTDSHRQVEVDPKCKQNNREHYISANGFYMPCCYVGEHSFYYKSEFYKNQSQYDISKTTISEILGSTQSKDFYNSLEDAKLSYCTFNCPKL